MIHKMANRRLGVQYPVKEFECHGSRDLPEPGTIPPSPAESVNGVQEFRPDFRITDPTTPAVKPFFDQVVDDCTNEWDAQIEPEEEQVDRKKVSFGHYIGARIGRRELTHIRWKSGSRYTGSGYA